ncbi:hypothetical protein CEXT_598651 [Caerostris extrusa]|uniref:Transposase n=1 Tax=Caerostris extrusa TaxID=172846 RepID=A0AAV4USK5_CAEEX|nr:hypothetical protein CEXT_598651 [Caerostris extrusa]
MKRSSILNKSDELLPEGVLTIRCELFYRTYTMPIDNSIEERNFKTCLLARGRCAFWAKDEKTFRIELYKRFMEISNLATGSDINTRPFRDYRTVFSNILKCLKH